MGEHHYAPVPIIDRVAAVLDMVMETPDGVRPGELLRAEGIPKMTLYRLLTAGCACIITEDYRGVRNAGRRKK